MVVRSHFIHGMECVQHSKDGYVVRLRYYHRGGALVRRSRIRTAWPQVFVPSCDWCDQPPVAGSSLCGSPECAVVDRSYMEHMDRAAGDYSYRNDDWGDDPQLSWCDEFGRCHGCGCSDCDCDYQRNWSEDRLDEICHVDSYNSCVGPILCPGCSLGLARSVSDYLAEQEQTAARLSRPLAPPPVEDDDLPF